MYHAIVRRRVTAMFGLLTQGDWPQIVRWVADDVHHVFPGRSPLAGERHRRASVLAWFERLGRLYPGHDFTVHRVVSSGWPWSTWVAVHWSARLRPQQGEPYTNHGAHWIHLRWAKVTSFHAYLDTELIAASCAAMARAGIDEAAAAPIADR